MTHIFIINPASGQSELTDNLRERLSRIEGLRFFIFITRYERHEAVLIKQILHFFEGEKLRIYCCGGSGTFRNVITGCGDLSGIEFAFFPCGKSNDFLKMFGAEEHRFRDLNALINGKAEGIDYIRTNHGLALNTVSLGLDSVEGRLLDTYDFFKTFSDAAPYTLASIHALVMSQAKPYVITTDDEEAIINTAEIIFANGSLFGGTIYVCESPDMRDGKADYLIASRRRGIGQLPLFAAMIKPDFAKIRAIAKTGSSKRLTLKLADGQPFTVNFDGELIDGVTYLEAEVVEKGLSFVIPERREST